MKLALNEQSAPSKRTLAPTPVGAAAEVQFPRQLEPADLSLPSSLPNVSTQKDVLEQLKHNVAQLEDLHGRLKFMMGEVQSLVKKIRT